MKKKIILLLITLISISCSSSDDESNQSSKSPYNPPSWIIGTWGTKDDNGTPETALFKFSSDNVCQFLLGTSTMCWKEFILQYPNGFLSGNDKSTSTTYEANIIEGKGATTTTHSFVKVSATKIKWKSFGGDIELEKLD